MDGNGYSVIFGVWNFRVDLSFFGGGIIHIFVVESRVSQRALEHKDNLAVFV